MYKIILFFISAVYYFTIQLSIAPNDKTNSYSFSAYSHIPQNVKLHIQAKRNQLKYIVCNSQKFSFSKRGRLWFERQSEEIIVALERGKNECRVELQKNVKAFHLMVKRKFDYVEYMVLFVLLVLPLIALVFRGFMSLLEYIKNKTKFGLPVFSTVDNNFKIPLYIWGILALGMLIRVMYFHKYGIMHFQHDWQGHVEFIKYMASHWTLPLGEKGLQFPQQPLYYVVAGGIYAIGLKFGLSQMAALHLLGYFALMCSFVFLYYGYKFFTLLTESKWVHTVALLFISLTPSLVYMSARINNDVLVMALSAYALYYSVKSYQSQFYHYFYMALLGVTLLFMTKISAAPIEIFLFVLLVLVYLADKDNIEIQRRLYIFSIVGMFALGFTLLKTYIPIEQTFHMVNSSAGFPGQIIEHLDIEYFTAFHFPSLIEVAYSYVFGEDTIRYSFLTYQYGTMFFGEFDYSKSFIHISYIKWIMQAILALGLVYIVGFILYLVTLKKASFLHQSILFVVVLNFLLIVKFMSTYSVVCNTDYRYFVVSFVLLAFIFSQGLQQVQVHRGATYFFSSIIGILSLCEVVFFIILLS